MSNIVTIKSGELHFLLNCILLNDGKTSEEQLKDSHVYNVEQLASKHIIISGRRWVEIRAAPFFPK